MRIRRLLALLFIASIGSSANAADADSDQALLFLKQHCVRCHNATKQEGEVRLDNLSPTDEKDAPRWLVIRDQLRDGLMPPEGEPRPNKQQVQSLIAWASAKSRERVGRLPNHGNLVPHELLFGKQAANASQAASKPATATRIWRLSPDTYKGFVRDVHRGRQDGIVQPFTLVPERGIKNFSSLYSVDESSTEILLRNAETIVAAQAAHEIVDGKVRGKNDTVREFVVLMNPAEQPTDAMLVAAIQTQFRLAIGRKPTEDEVQRYRAFYEKNVVDNDWPSAAKTMLQAILLRGDAMYRFELGEPTSESNGRRRLSQSELARAIAVAICDRREGMLDYAAEKGLLTTTEQIATHVRRILDEPKIEKPGMLRFFREYFEYDRAVEIFKDKPKDFKHEPRVLVSDTDRLVRYVLDADRDVFRQLLTTPVSFVNALPKMNKQTRKEELVRAVQPDEANKNRPYVIHSLEHVYGLEEWPTDQPARMPKETRIGILMQPSWLVAFSTNFDNDPVRRGRWVRERLLGGTVPDLPIGVAAQVPDEKHRTFRDRLTVTRAAKCWKCHQRMDDLGLPFENFDHYGRYRTAEPVLDLEATEKNVDKKGNPLGPVLRDVELNTAGLVADSGESSLDGLVRNPREMIERLAASDRVRQVFVRHVFRYFLGRNESPADAVTLQNADAAYLQNDGSFKALLVSLLTSDSFLYRE